jgi:Flp pilus assembly protein TadD
VTDAVPELRTALRIQPKDWEAHFLLGGGLESQKDFDGAAAEYRAALALHPGYAPAQSRLAKLMAGK